MRPLVLAALTALLACRTAPPRAEGEPPPLPPLDRAALDESVSPCEDFYEFACGGWLATTEIPAERASWDRGFSAVEERNLRELRRILEDAAAGTVDPQDRFGRKMGDFYAACLDEDGIEARGLADLKAEWARIDAIQDRGDLAGELGRLAASGLAVPFELLADQDARDATQVVLWLWQGGLSLPDREHHLGTGGKSPEIRQRWLAHVRAMLRLAGVPAAAAEADAAAIADLERRLAEAQWSRVELREPARVSNRVDRPGLERLAPGFPWARWFAALGRPTLAPVVVSTPRFVERVGKLFDEAPLPAWRAYLRWTLLREMAGSRALPRVFVEEAFRFESASFSGASVLRPRWKHCVAATDEAMGFALGESYVRRHFGGDAKARTVRLVGAVERALGAALDASAWMDAPTRAAAREKLAKVVNKVGYPEVGRDYSALKVGRESYFRNVLSATRFELARQLAKIGKPVDRAEWTMSPPTVNAYYNPSLNEMVFPAGILQPPFFHPDAPDPVNLGAIGMVVGHELSHGFDDQGRQFDTLGNLRDWWSPASARAFDERAQCLVRQFSAYEPVAGVKLDGALTLGENLADLAGVRIAWSAHLAARAGKKGRDRKVAGFNPAQQFFVGFAQSWCEKRREEDERLRAATDPHAPARFRVNGPLSNLPEFAAAFSCKPGSAMVREERCSVW